MNELSNQKKLCFLCDKFLNDDNRIQIKDITPLYVKRNIVISLEKFKTNKLITNIDSYDLNNVHGNCSKKRKEKLGKI